MLFIGDQNCLNNAQPFASFPTSPMLGARPRPPLRRPPPPIVPGERAGFSSPATSPNWWRSQDSDGVGLGIVAALNKSGDHLPKPAAVVYSPRLCRSGQGPISVSARNLAGGGEWVDSDSECYTCVTCRGGHGQSPVTRVYYGGTEVGPGVQFELSSPTAKQEESANLHAGGGEKIGFLASDFLSSCYLCHKKLHGKDIYMYRGEKAFCSAECRSQQMASDEYMESCGSEVSKASDVVAVSAYDHGRFFLPGIVAA